MLQDCIQKSFQVSECKTCLQQQHLRCSTVIEPKHPTLIALHAKVTNALELLMENLIQKASINYIHMHIWHLQLKIPSKYAKKSYQILTSNRNYHKQEPITTKCCPITRSQHEQTITITPAYHNYIFSKDHIKTCSSLLLSITIQLEDKLRLQY